MNGPGIINTKIKKMRPKYHAETGPGGIPKLVKINRNFDLDDSDEDEIPQMHWRPKTKDQIEKEKMKDDYKTNRIWF